MFVIAQDQISSMYQMSQKVTLASHIEIKISLFTRTMI